jgi:hypothetical protein
VTNVVEELEVFPGLTRKASSSAKMSSELARISRYTTRGSRRRDPSRVVAAADRIALARRIVSA